MFIRSSFSRNGKETHTDQRDNVLTLSEKKGLTNIQKKQLKKTFSPVCILSVQLASMFLTLCDNWKTLFFTKNFRFSEVFVTAVLLRFLTEVL